MQTPDGDIIIDCLLNADTPCLLYPDLYLGHRYIYADNDNIKKILAKHNVETLNTSKISTKIVLCDGTIQNDPNDIQWNLFPKDLINYEESSFYDLPKSYSKFGMDRIIMHKTSCPPYKCNYNYNGNITYMEINLHGNYAVSHRIWAYPIIVVAIVPAITLDIMTSPYQLYILFSHQHRYGV